MALSMSNCGLLGVFIEIFDVLYFITLFKAIGTNFAPWFLKKRRNLVLKMLMGPETKYFSVRNRFYQFS